MFAISGADGYVRVFGLTEVQWLLDDYRMKIIYEVYVNR